LRIHTRYALVLLALSSLACSGASEKVFHWTTGGEIEETEEGGAEVRLPGGIRISVDASGDVPDSCPMPPPWAGARPETATTSHLEVDGTPIISLALSYPLSRPTDAVEKVYMRWMRGRLVEAEKLGGKGQSGWTYSRKSKSILPGLRFTRLALEQKPGGKESTRESFEVLITEGYGVDSIAVTHTLEGADQFPSAAPPADGGEEAVESKKALSSD